MGRDIDEIIRRVKDRVPAADVSQLQVKHPGADDDGLWFFSLPGNKKRIQIESSFGQCPFMVEHDDMKSTPDAWTANSIDEAVEMVSSYLLALSQRE